MYLRGAGRLCRVMSTPTVTEIVPRPEPIVHDPFIDDLRVRALKQAVAAG
jgi:hypothetical protein